MAKPFVTPFATGGDKSVVPDAQQADGSVSYTQGFGPDYQQEQGTPGAKDVPRDKTNQIFADITGAIAELQRLGFPEYYAELAPYPQGATVWRAGTAYMSTVGNNNTVPGASGASWIALGGDTTPVGMYGEFSAPAPPVGYLACDGQAYNRAGQYAALFSVIGTRYGAGNGSTTFNVPDFRGEFSRAWDMGKGVDNGRTFASFQQGSLIVHDLNAGTGVQTARASSPAQDNAASFGGDPVSSAAYPGVSEAGISASGSPLGTNTILSMARPRNISVLKVIKF